MKSVGIPLVLTFKLDPFSQERLDLLRERYFPKESNHLQAHLTIFHQLPGQEIAPIRILLKEFSETVSPFEIAFDRLLTKQGFVGIGVSSDAMQDARTKLTEVLAKVLRAQDKQAYRPHVTVTNLGSPKAALKCYAELESTFVPWRGKSLGLELYHYRGGPWELAETYSFSASNML